MNLYLRGIDGNIQLGDSIRDDKFPNLRADTVITNPPFNMSEWGRETVADDDPDSNMAYHLKAMLTLRFCSICYLMPLKTGE